MKVGIEYGLPLIISPGFSNEQCTVGESNIANTKIRNNYGAIQSFIFAIAILDFSLFLH